MQLQRVYSGVHVCFILFLFVTESILPLICLGQFHLMYPWTTGDYMVKFLVRQTDL